jgi:hypothetical protein
MDMHETEEDEISSPHQLIVNYDKFLMVFD